MNQMHLVSLMTRFSQRRSHQEKKVFQGSRQSGAQNSEIAWSGEARICSKQRKHYLAFCRMRTKINVHSVVWILSSGKRNDYLGYVEDMYENEEGVKMVRVRKFIFHKDMEGMTPKLYPMCKEVFITPMVEHIGAHSIDGVAAVLAPAHFHRCDEALPLGVWRRTLMCSGEFKHKCISAELAGYYSQPLLSYLGSYLLGNSSLQLLKTNVPEPEDQVLFEVERILSFFVTREVCSAVGFGARFCVHPETTSRFSTMISWMVMNN